MILAYVNLIVAHCEEETFLVPVRWPDTCSVRALAAALSPGNFAEIQPILGDARELKEDAFEASTNWSKHEE